MCGNAGQWNLRIGSVEMPLWVNGNAGQVCQSLFMDTWQRWIGMHRHINGYVATLVHWAPASARLDDGGKMATLEKARNPSPPPPAWDSIVAEIYSFPVTAAWPSGNNVRVSGGSLCPTFQYRSNPVDWLSLADELTARNVERGRLNKVLVSDFFIVHQLGRCGWINREKKTKKKPQSRGARDVASANQRPPPFVSPSQSEWTIDSLRRCVFLSIFLQEHDMEYYKRYDPAVQMIQWRLFRHEIAI